MTSEEALAIGKPDKAGQTIYVSGGECAHCGGRGYKGRIGVFEMLPIDMETARMIVHGANEADIAKHARQRNILSIREDAEQKLFNGLTTVEEIVSVTDW
jgi:type IV pilus assembly protein PilB